MARLLQRLDENGTGPLITLDEVQDADRGELLQLAAVSQHWVRDGLPERMNASLQLASHYRSRLIEAGLIEPADRGEVTYSIPGLRKHLRSGDLLD